MMSILKKKPAAQDSKNPPKSQSNEPPRMAKLEDILAREANVSKVLSYMKAQATISVIAMIVALVLVMIAINHESPPRYIAVDNDGRILRPVLLDKPIANDSTVTAWSSSVMMDVFSVDFANYRRILKTAKPSFSEKGWSDFIELYDKEFLSIIKEQSAVSTATPTGAAIVEAQGLLEGVYTWKISQPFLIDFIAGNKSRSYKYVITALVQRSQTLVNPVGLEITRVQASLGEREKRNEF